VIRDRRRELILVGLDVIGGMLTEINITSPTGVRQASRLDDRNVAAPILDCFERLSKQLRG
jgi:glutathione synthase